MMTIEELKADLLPDPLGDAVELTSAQMEFLVLAPEILALVEAANSCLTEDCTGHKRIIEGEDTRLLEEALDAFNAKLAAL